MKFDKLKVTEVFNQQSVLFKWDRLYAFKGFVMSTKVLTLSAPNGPTVIYTRLNLSPYFYPKLYNNSS